MEDKNPSSEAIVGELERDRVRAFLKTVRGFFSATEPVWVTGLAAWVYLWVYLSYLHQVEPFFTWLGLIVACFPFLWRLVRYGYRGIRTPFDRPLGLLVAGAAIGVCVSPDFEISLGAFQSLLAATLVYYSFCNYRRPGTLLKVALPFAGCSILVAALVAFSSTPLPVFDAWVHPWVYALAHRIPWLRQTATQSGFAFGLNYGLALAMSVAAAFCASFAVFGKRAWLRLGATLGSFLFVAAVVSGNYAGILRLITSASIESRTGLWRLTIDLLQESPLTGLGLGAWPLLAYPGAASFPHGHPHNAYLELYSNMGILGVLALLVSLVVAARIGWGILRSSRANPWYGVGVGVLLAGVVTALFGVIEKAPIAVIVLGAEAYFYVVSPLPWLLAVALVLVHRLLKRGVPKKEEGVD